MSERLTLHTPRRHNVVWVFGDQHRAHATSYRVLRCAPGAEVGCTIDGTECGRWVFRSERVAGAERGNGGTVGG